MVLVIGAPYFIDEFLGGRLRDLSLVLNDQLISLMLRGVLVMLLKLSEGYFLSLRDFVVIVHHNCGLSMGHSGVIELRLLCFACLL